MSQQQNGNVNSRALTFQQTSGSANAPRTAKHTENTNFLFFPFLFPFPDVTATSWNVNSRELSFQQLATAPSTASQEENHASVVATDSGTASHAKRMKIEKANPNVTATNWNVNSRSLTFQHCKRP